MIVRCLFNEGSSLPESCLDPAAGITSGVVFPLTVGSFYVVHAITVFRGHTWYYVLDDNELPYPVWKLAELFDVSDGSLPSWWVTAYVRVGLGVEGYPVLSFPEWALDRFFYERLVDGDPTACSVFESRRIETEQPSS